MIQLVFVALSHSADRTEMCGDNWHTARLLGNGLEFPIRTNGGSVLNLRNTSWISTMRLLLTISRAQHQAKQAVSVERVPNHCVVAAQSVPRDAMWEFPHKD